MPDVFTTAKRSEVMSRIRGSGNCATEMRMISLLRKHNISGWRRGQRVFGKPDFVFRRERVAVFVDGCFWYRHLGCRFAYTPKSRSDFWLSKFDRNVTRDKLVGRKLRQAGCEFGSATWQARRQVELPEGSGAHWLVFLKGDFKTYMPAGNS